MDNVFDRDFWLDRWREEKRDDTMAVHKGFSTAAYWDKAAQTYNRNKDELLSRKLEKTLDLFKSRGLLFPGMKVLDIGCGTGHLAIELARRGAHVTAIDFSEGMLERLRQELPGQLAPNVDILHKDFKNMDTTSLGSAQKFDLVIAFMSPAVSTPESFFKMISLSRKGCAIRGWCDRRRHPILDALWEKIMQRPLVDRPQSILYKINLLFSMGTFPDIICDTIEWEQEVTLDEEFAGQMAFFEKSSDLAASKLEKIIRTHLESIARNGIINRKHKGTTATAVWHVTSS